MVTRPELTTVAVEPEMVSIEVLLLLQLTPLAVPTVKEVAVLSTYSGALRLTGVAASLAPMESAMPLGMGYRPGVAVKAVVKGRAVPTSWAVVYCEPGFVVVAYR